MTLPRNPEWWAAQDAGFEKGYKIMPVECLENPFWFVIDERSCVESYADCSGHTADTEIVAIALAEQLAALNPGKNFFVMKSVTRSKSTNTVTTRYR